MWNQEWKGLWPAAIAEEPELDVLTPADYDSHVKLSNDRLNSMTVDDQGDLKLDHPSTLKVRLPARGDAKLGEVEEDSSSPDILKKRLRNRERRQKRKRKDPLCHPDLKHNCLTHFPKDPDCPICQACRTTRAQCRAGRQGDDGSHVIEAKAFADQITADHIILGNEHLSTDSERVALIIQDRFTYWIKGFAAKTKRA